MQESKIVKLHKALELLRDNIRGKESRTELPVQMLLTFLLVAQQDGVTMLEAAKELGVMQSTISRNVKDLDVYLEAGPGGVNVQKGCGLVYRAPNQFNRREFSVFTSPKGQKLLKQIEKILE